MNSDHKSPTLGVIDRDGNRTAERYAIPHAAPAAAGAIPPFEHCSDRATFNYTDRYALWRRSKCRPVAPGDDGAILADLDQATHELVGEVAEAAGLIAKHGANCFITGPARLELIDELGDVFFTGSWVGDAWGRNPLLDLRGYHASEVLVPAEESAWDMHRVRMVRAARYGEFDPKLWGHIQCATIKAQSSAGLLANHYKKLRFQHRPQDVAQVYGKLAVVLQWAAKFAVLADATTADCLHANIVKLDHRYPGGFVEGSGGGDRTGVGA